MNKEKKEYPFPKVHTFMVKEVCMAKKGQITIPKAIRDEDGMQEGDLFTVTHTPTGDIVFKVKKQQDPVDHLIKFLKSMPPIDADKAWQEILKERRKEHR